MKFFWNLLAVYEDENDNKLGSVLLSLHGVILCASVLILMINAAVWNDPRLEIALFTFILLLIITAVLLVRGWLQASSLTLAVICIVMITALAMFGGGIRDYILVIYPMVILFSAITFPRFGIILSTSLSILSITWLVAGENLNYFTPSTVTRPGWADLATLLILIIISAWAVRTMTSNTHESMKRALRELAERKRVEASLRHNQTNLQAILENTDDLIWSIDTNYNLIVANSVFQKAVLLSLNEPIRIGESVLSTHFSVETLQDWKNFYDKALYGEKTVWITRATLPAKTDAIMEYRIGPIMDTNGLIQGATVFGRDITENKRSQEALHDSEERYRLLAEKISDVIWILDVNDFRFTYVSPSVERLRGYTPEEVIAEHASKSLTKESMQLLENNLPIVLSRFINGEKIEDYYVDQVEQPCKDGSTVWTETTTQFLQNNETGHIEVYGVSRDITQRRKVEAALKASEAHYRAVVEDQTELICRFHPDSTLIFANKVFCQFFGLSQEEVQKHDFINLLYNQADRLEAAARIQKLLKDKGREVYEHQVRSINGETRWLQWIDRAICNPEGHVVEIQSVGRDITDVKELQQKQQEYTRIEERQRLARDLHDAVSQTLFSARLISESLIQKKQSISQLEIWENIHNITQLISSALGEMRILLLELRPENLIKADLSSILKHLVDATAVRTHAQIRLEASELEKLPAEVKIGFYRITQEALNNAIKHSQSKNIFIKYHSDRNEAILVIEDDGQGIRVDEKRQGMGLGIMKERAMEINAAIEISQEPHSGTRISCIWKNPQGDHNESK